MAKKKIHWGSYYKADSLVHSLDARAKIVASLIFLTAIFLADNIGKFAVLYAFTVLAVALSRVPVGSVLRSLRFVLFLAVFSALMNSFFTPGDVLYDFGALQITKEGLYQGVLMMLRLFLLIGFASLLTLTTPPILLTDALESLFSPFKRLGLPGSELALMIGIALRFIPILLQEMSTIAAAQRARGADMRKLKNVAALMVPLFSSSLARAEDLALAMDSRGYQSGAKRSKLREASWCVRDSLALVLVCLLLAVMIIWPAEKFI